MDVVTIKRIHEAVVTAKSDLDFIREDHDSLELVSASYSLGTVICCLERELELCEKQE